MGIKKREQQKKEGIKYCVKTAEEKFPIRQNFARSVAVLWTR